MALSARALHFKRGLSELPDKLKTLSKFSFPLATHKVKDVNSELKGPVTLNGHLHRKPRIQARRSFAELRDIDGDVIQLYMDPNVTPENSFMLLKASGTEDSVSVTGHIQKKVPKKGQENAEYEMVVSGFQNLNHAGVEAAQLDDLKHNSPQDIPPQFRFLQLRGSALQKALKIRSKVAHLVRNTLIDEHNFTEIETPLLFKSTPEGAREFLVPTRLPNRFYALPQSPQQYKQILMSSGFARYFQFAKCFRDEDLRADRQPEFTQIDLELSFINSKRQVTEVITSVFKKIWLTIMPRPLLNLGSDGYLHPVASDTSFSSLDYIEALTKYGIDKPDLRSNLSFIDLSPYVTPLQSPAEFPVLEACVLKSAFVPSEKGSRIPHVLTEARNYSRRKPIIVALESEHECKSWHRKFLEKEVFALKPNASLESLQQILDLCPGDILAFSTRAEMPYENPTPLGKLRQLAIQAFPEKWNRPIMSSSGAISTDYVRNKEFVATWVVNFPLFSPKEVSEGSDLNFPKYSTSQLEATHHPFTMAVSEDYELLSSEPLKVHGEHYDLVVNGVEVGGGSRRIHDPDLQKFVFEQILKIQNYELLFGHLLKALSFGCPPHAGIALGFDRLCAMIIGSETIRDVIAFPKNQSGSDPVVDSPTDVSPTTLGEYFIKKI